jgi:hypothetical protein
LDAVPVDTFASRATSARVGAGGVAGSSAGRDRPAVFVMLLRARRKAIGKFLKIFPIHFLSNIQ